MKINDVIGRNRFDLNYSHFTNHGSNSGKARHFLHQKIYVSFVKRSRFFGNVYSYTIVLEICRMFCLLCSKVSREKGERQNVNRLSTELRIFFSILQLTFFRFNNKERHFIVRERKLMSKKYFYLDKKNLLVLLLCRLNQKFFYFSLEKCASGRF